MTQEDKELLLKDLSGRLSYGVKVNITYSHENASSFRQRVCIEGNNELSTDIIGLYQGSEIDIKPYLFPLSSMTEELKEETSEMFWDFDNNEFTNNTEIVDHCDCINIIDWLNKNHFDYRGLIEKGLAIDATGLNIY